MRTLFGIFLITVTLPAETINLATVLKLSGADPIEVKLAEEKLTEARAEEKQRVLAFLPILSVGVGYKNHQGAIQDVVGTVFDTGKYQYSPGATAAVELSLGKAGYERLAARQRAVAAGEEIASKRLITQARAAAAYFELIRAHAAQKVAEEAVRISADYGKQVTGAVDAGVAFKGDALRVEVQTKRNQMALERANGAVKQSSTALAAALRLDPSEPLSPADPEPAVLKMVDTSAPTASLLEKAMGARPELARDVAALAAVQAERDAVVKGPWVPTLTAQAYAGGLDGGISGQGNRGLRHSEDYLIGLSWKIGAGGLFDKGRQQAAESRVRQAALAQAQTKETVRAEVVSAVDRVNSLAAELEAARETVKAAEENNKITRSREEFAVGVVLETVLSEQELTSARLQYLEAVTAHNAAQFHLHQVIGALK